MRKNFFKIIAFLFIYTAVFAEESNSNNISNIENTDFFNISDINVKKYYKNRSWNGIIIPERIWKLIDKYRFEIIQYMLYNRTYLPASSSPNYIMDKLKKLVAYNDSFFCLRCETDIPIMIKKECYKRKELLALDGLPYERDDINPPLECPICGMFYDKTVPFMTKIAAEYWNDKNILLYENCDVWERYFYFLNEYGIRSYEKLHMYQKAAWYNKYDNDTFRKYTIMAINELNDIISQNNYNSSFFYDNYDLQLRKAELLRQIGCFEKSKEIIDELSKRDNIEKYLKVYFYELLDKKETKLVPMPVGNKLHNAIAFSEKDEVSDKIKELAKDKELINDFYDTMINPLGLAIYQRKNNIALYLLKHGGNINASTSIGVAPLFQAVVNGDKEFLKLVINKNNVNLSDSYGYTPICYAIRVGNLDIVKLLVELGANPTYYTSPSDNSKKRIIDLAIQIKEMTLESYTEIVEYLLSLPQINKSKEILENLYDKVELKFSEKLIDDIDNKYPENYGEYVLGTPKIRAMIRKAYKTLLEKEQKTNTTKK